MTRIDHTEAGGGDKGVEEVVGELGLEHRDGRELVHGWAGDVGEADGDTKVQTLCVASVIAGKSNTSECFIRQRAKLVEDTNNFGLRIVKAADARVKHFYVNILDDSHTLSLLLGVVLEVVVVWLILVEHLHPVSRLLCVSVSKGSDILWNISQVSELHSSQHEE